jgi:hypothetical protein
MKHIRPLSAFKRTNPKTYALAMSFVDSGSKKDRENAFYRIYARWYSGIPWDLSDGGPIQWNPFYFDKTNQEVNRAIVTEMGRLLLAGWYYNVQPFTVEVCGYIYKSYLKKREAFNELEFADKLKHIRENIGYYVNNPNDLKLYVLESFFPDELAPMLPEKPEVLQLLEVAHKSEQEEKSRHDKHYYFNLTCEQEAYIEHLHSILKEKCIPFQSFKDFTAEREKQHQDFIKQCIEADRAYRERVRKTAQFKIGDMLTQSSTIHSQS